MAEDKEIAQALAKSAPGANVPEENVLDSARRRAARRARDEELAALASLALIRSGMESRHKIREERSKDAKPTPEELEERLRSIINDADKH